MTDATESKPWQQTLWHIEETFAESGAIRYLCHADKWSADKKDRIGFFEVTALQHALDRLRAANPDGEFRAVQFTATYFGNPPDDMGHCPDLDQLENVAEGIIEPASLDAAALSFIRERLDSALQAFRHTPLSLALTPGKIQSLHAQQLEQIIALRHAMTVLQERAETHFANLPWQHPETRAILTGRARRFLAFQPRYVGAVSQMLFYRDPLQPDLQPLWAIMPHGSLIQTSTNVMPADPTAARAATATERPTSCPTPNR